MKVIKWYVSFHADQPLHTVFSHMLGDLSSKSFVSFTFIVKYVKLLNFALDY